MPNKIYFDHSATTPADEQVVKAMQPFWSDNFGNPSSLHTFGQEAIQAVDASREKIAEFLGCQASEVIFTSGATESNNLAIQGVIKAYWLANQANQKTIKPHIITTVFEHPCVLDTVKEFEKCCIEATFIKPNQDGIIEVDKVKQAIQDNTILISIMYVNNEIGTIQPIVEIGQMIQKHKNTKTQKHKNNKSQITRLPDYQFPIFHTDAVQALNYCNCDINDLKVDLLSLSGHKIYGPKGIGALYIKNKTPIQPIQYGGHQEYGIRPGTTNAPLIAGLGKAVEIINNQQLTINKEIKQLRDRLWQGIQNKIKGVRLNGSLEKRAPNNLNINFKKVEGESLLLSLDMEGIAVSTGSACSSGSLEPSHVLLSLGYQREETHGSLRITLGRGNTRAEIDRLLEILPKTINRLRGIAPSD